jgi:hypothetical protein
MCLIFGRTWRFLVAQIATFSISATSRQLTFIIATLFLYTPHARNYLLLRCNENAHGTILWLHVSTAVHNSATMRPIHKIIDYTTYLT